MKSVGLNVSEQLKVIDPDRFFSTLPLPGDVGQDIRTLYAFSAEIAQTRERVSDPAVGEIRLQYWLDFLSGTDHGHVEQNPLAQTLQLVIDHYDLPTGPLRRLLNARRFDLYDDAMANLAAFEGYAGETNSILYQLASMVANGGNDAGAADAAGHIGVAHAIIGHLRALAITASRGQIYLPWSVFAEFDVVEQDVFAGKASQGIIAACGKFRQIAAEHLALADKSIVELPANIRPVFCQTTILRSQLDQLQKFSDLPFVCPPESADWQKIAKIVWWTIKN